MKIMVAKYNELYSFLPEPHLSEIKRIASGFSGGISAVSEIRLVRGFGSSFVMGGHRHKLYSLLKRDDMEELFFKVCSGAVYAHRDTVTEGYVSTREGIRVGVSGTARYDGGRLVGVSDINALVFRIPTADSSFGEELYLAYTECERGLLVYSKAGVGKTTALRTLVPLIAKRDSRENVVVVDERCEFDPEACESCGVMLLRGYERSRGMDIALRTLAASVIVIDEISSAQESAELSSSLLSGVKFIASAHAEHLSEVVNRRGVKPLIENGVFDVFFGIRYTDGGYSHEVEKRECLRL